MGHLFLGNLSHTHKWKQVIKLLEGGADIPELADASFRAAMTGLHRVPSDPGFLTVLNGIVELASASHKHDSLSAFDQAGVSASDCKSSFGFVSAIARNLSERLHQVYPRSDTGKIAQDALLESLTRHFKSKTGSLFGHAEDTKSLVGAFKGNQFKSLMHEFYTSFTSRYLSYYLSRELPNHVGGGKRFANLDEHSIFNENFDLYCRQSVRIVDEFTPGWIGKAIYEGDAGADAVKRYAHVAFKKLASEFQRSGSQ